MADTFQVQPSARVKLLKNNGKVLYDQNFSPAADDLSEYSGQSLEIAAAGSATLSLGGLAVARKFILQASSKITVKVNGQASGLALVGTEIVYAAFSCSLTQVVVTNNSATDVVAITYLATD